MSLVSDIANGRADPIPLEQLRAFIKAEVELLGLFLRQHRAEPLTGKDRRQHDWPPCMSIILPCASVVMITNSSCSLPLPLPLPLLLPLLLLLSAR